MKRIRTLVLTFLLITFMLTFNVQAYDNTLYYNNQKLKVGLISMKNSNLSITLYGSYTINGASYNTNSTIILKLNNGKIEFNGGLYDQIEIKSLSLTYLMDVKSGSVTRKYFGDMLFTVSSGQILPVNTVYIEDYLKGVVAYEMSDSYPLEALKAQAIAARNYALSSISSSDTLYNLTDTEGSQVYKGYNSSYTNVIRSVEETKGVLLLSNDKLISAYFAASNGGYTEASENVWLSSLPYLKSLKDDFDNELWSGDLFLSESWKAEADIKQSGGQGKASYITGAYVTFNFRGSAVRWFGLANNTRGGAEVILDGVVQQQVNCYSSTPQYQKVLFEKLNLDPNVTHTIKIRALGVTSIPFDAIEIDTKYGEKIRYEENEINHKKFSTKTLNDKLNRTNIKSAIASQKKSDPNYASFNGDTDIFVKIDTAAIKKYTSGRISSIPVYLKNSTGLIYSIYLSKESARTFLGLPSAMYDVVYDSSKDVYTFYGKGYGHGIGMSQIGARNRAKAGQDYETILKFYYQGIVINNTVSQIAALKRNLSNMYTNDLGVFSTQSLYGSGQGTLYRYTIMKDDVLVYDSDFTSNPILQYKVRQAGNYKVAVYIKDVLSIIPYEDSTEQAFTVNYAGEGDINVDKIVDIYDLVKISKNLGEKRESSTKWNERLNLVDSDSEINMLDVAKAAKNYNFKY